MTYIKGGPGSFVSPPFIKCPKCGKEKFGISSIHNQHYTRRCKECWYPKGREPSESFPLPELKKKILYVDQFALSNMMKTLNPKTKAFKKGNVDEYWLSLFERLDSLCKLQLIVCPDSIFHRFESYLSPFYPALRRMYLQLSHGLIFFDHKTIQRFQICNHALKWLEGKETEKVELDIEGVTHGSINAWQDKIIISVDMPVDEKLILDLRKTREKTSHELQEISKLWQAETDKSFDYWYEKEWPAYGSMVLSELEEYIIKYAKNVNGNEPSNLEYIMPPESSVLIASLQYTFRDAGLEKDLARKKTFEYLKSDALQYVPFNKISSMLWAAIARKFATGRKKPLSKGTVNDIHIISVLLPYCDAMFIDRECHGYLMENPLSGAIDYGTKLFSLSNKDEFMKYLNGIEKSATMEHMNAVKEVYGDRWKEPYVTMYK